MFGVFTICCSERLVEQIIPKIRICKEYNAMELKNAKCPILAFCKLFSQLNMRISDSAA